MATNPGSCVISPEGKLGSCEHFIDSNFYSSIYSSPLENDIYQKRFWRELYKYSKVEGSACDTCFYFPKCLKLLHCEPNGICDEIYRERLSVTLEEQILFEFERYKNKNKDIITKFIEMNNGDDNNE